MKLKVKFDRALRADKISIISFTAENNWLVGELAGMINKLVQDGKEWLEIDVKEYKSKRSIEQNSLMWAMIDKLSELECGRKDHSKVWEKYIELLERTGQKYEYILALPEAVELLSQSFRAIKHVEDRDYNGKKMGVYKCFYGSSKFSTKEMTDFIEAIMDELAERGWYEFDTV